MSHCSCAPHPVVDLPSTPNPPGHSDESSTVATVEYTAASERLRLACRSHGCFHLRLRRPPPSLSPLLRVEGGSDGGSGVGSLFEPSLLSHLDLDPGAALAQVGGRFYYRGRTAESGGGGRPEPKQSWEVRKCRRLQGEVDCLHTPRRMEQLDGWVSALHEAAGMVMAALGIRSGVVLGDSPCRCDELPSPPKGPPRWERCSSDILRVFRYDALPDISNQQRRPGSSSHTDWGSLTVVWQDERGGLQTHCSVCDAWSDVDASIARASVGDEDVVHLFVHIGDCLSLATGGLYPSPRHRVLCPIRRTGGSRRLDEGRTSLVYFAYPPPGISLRDIEGALRSDGAYLGTEEMRAASCHHYSLLANQSATSEGVADDERKDETDASRAYRTYKRIRGIPFDHVVREKWNQVQRFASGS